MTISEKNQEKKRRFEKLSDVFRKYSPYLAALCFAERETLETAFEEGYDDAFAALLRRGYRELYFERERERVFKGLRVLKRRAALLAAAADVEGCWNVPHLTRALSVLAELCVRIAVSFALRDAVRKGVLNLPDSKSPEKGCGFFVLAMGKLGGRELNYSSDIDLIALFDGDKAPYVGKKDVGSFFVRLTKDVISLLDERGEDGYVFRVDMRLRPDPGSTPVAVSSAAAECYYESFAQNWERAAFIKARVIAGDKTAGEAFLKNIRPFVWRRTSDFYVLEQIRSLKYSFAGARPSASDLKGRNVKLGHGGIREIEFFTQLQQLLWGGRDPKLRVRSTLNALNALKKAGWVSESDCSELKEAYVFLRTVEHRLQMVADEQTQTLPLSDEEFEKLAKFSGFGGSAAFTEALSKHMERVCDAYDSLFKNETEETEERWAFGGTEIPAETLERLKGLGFKRLDFIADSVRGWLSGRYRAFRSERARTLMESLLPRVFRALAKTGDADGAFVRFDGFLQGLPSGIQLFSLFQSRPALLDLTAEVISSSPYLATWLARSPDLFDSVLSPDFFEPFPDLKALKAELAERFSAAESAEEILEPLNRFVREKKFRSGVRFLRGLDDGRAVGADLANLSDAALSVLCPAVRNEFEKRFGTLKGASFAFVVMGKAGSREMNFRSDLDILFLYDASEGTVSEGGRSELSAGTYFARLGQRLVGALTSNTKEGVLWAADMRLRPSGSAGPAAVAATSFRRYYASEAWTWEKMAMCKARVAWGDTEEAENDIRAVLTRGTDENLLRADVADMYRRVIEAHPPKSEWDVKYGAGGMVEIEFGVQYLQLKHGREHPDLLLRSVHSVLERARVSGLIPAETFEALDEAYLLWQNLSVLFSLCFEENETPSEETSGANEKICAFCGVSDFPSALEKVRETARRAALCRLF